jgi:hypothetical protein
MLRTYAISFCFEQRLPADVTGKGGELMRRAEAAWPAGDRSMNQIWKSSRS